jgi:hypothetical protein
LFHVHDYGVVSDRRFVSFSIWRYMRRKTKHSFFLHCSSRSKNICFYFIYSFLWRHYKLLTSCILESQDDQWMVNWKRSRRKFSLHNLWYYPSICLKGLRTITTNLSVYPVSGPTFESRIQDRCDNRVFFFTLHSTTFCALEFPVFMTFLPAFYFLQLLTDSPS